MTPQPAHGPDHRAPDHRRSSAFLYNAAVAAWAIGAAWEIGALDELAEHRKLDASEFALRHGLDPVATLGVFRALASVEIVLRHDDTIIVTDLFDEINRDRSFFHWLNRGSGELFREMPTLLATHNRVGEYYRRDPAAIAFACREISAVTFDPAFWAAIDRLGPDIGVVADIGCGSGGRVMQVLERFPGARGVGVDIAEPSLVVARREAADAGLGHRTAFLQGDALALAARPEYAEVDVLTCFMMGHDFWAGGHVVRTLRRLRETFPAARRFLLGDATRSVGVPDTEMPVFRLGFELAHDLMGTFIPTQADWHSVFGRSGWTLLRTHEIDIAAGEVIFELG